jgi:RNA polymerase sigma-70 factor (ECF subfamily)
MSNFPTTQIELLLKVSDRADHQAWADFVALYRPAIYRFARQRGFQEADAQDLVQTVLSAVAEKIADWKPDPDRAKFRTWLSRVAQNQTITMFRKRRVDSAKGGSSVIDLLASQPDESDHESELLTEYRREAFRHAARIVRQQVEETSWQAFWMTSVEQVAVADAAQTLGLSAGAVYTARSRIIRRLQIAVETLERQDHTLSISGLTSPLPAGSQPIDASKGKPE